MNRRLLAVVFLALASLYCFGAALTENSIRGTGGVLVTSNTITHIVTVDGSGISSPTGGVSATTATNIAIGNAIAIQSGAGNNNVLTNPIVAGTLAADVAVTALNIRATNFVSALSLFASQDAFVIRNVNGSNATFTGNFNGQTGVFGAALTVEGPFTNNNTAHLNGPNNLINEPWMTNGHAVRQFKMGDWVMQTNSDSSLVVSNGNLGYTFANYSPVGSFGLVGAPGPLETITPDVNIYGRLWVQGDLTNSGNLFSLGTYTGNGSGLSNLVQAPSFVWDGDSLVASLMGFSGFQYGQVARFKGMDLATYAAALSNFVNHSIYFNYALGGEFLSNIVTFRFPTNAGLLLTNLSAPKYYLPYAGHVDIGNGHNIPALTNNLISLWTSGRAAGAKVVAFTIQTNFVNWTVAAGGTQLVVNAWIRSPAAAAYYDYLVDVAAFVTNVNQTLDGTHLNDTNTMLFADLINRSINVTGFTKRDNDLTFYRPIVTASNLVMSGNSELAGMRVGGMYERDTVRSGLEFYWDTNLLTGTIQPVSGGARQILGIFANQINLGAPAGINLDATSYVASAKGPGIYFGITNSPTFPAAAGSTYQSTGGGTDGMLYVHTNSSINTSWYRVVLGAP